MQKVKFFSAHSIEQLDADVSAFVDENKADVIDVKLVINQSTHKPLHSTYAASLIYR